MAGGGGGGGGGGAPRVSSMGNLQPPFVPGQFMRPHFGRGGMGMVGGGGGGAVAAMVGGAGGGGAGVGPFNHSPGQFSPSHQPLSVNQSGIVFPIPPAMAAGYNGTTAQGNFLYFQQGGSHGIVPSALLPHLGAGGVNVGAGIMVQDTSSEGLDAPPPILPGGLEGGGDVVQTTSASTSKVDTTTASPVPSHIQAAAPPHPFSQEALVGGIGVVDETGSQGLHPMLGGGGGGVVHPLPPGNALLPQPMMPQVHASSSRKQILCRHIVSGMCPYGEKCWFAHPEPQQQREMAAPGFSPSNVPSSPLQVQLQPNLYGVGGGGTGHGGMGMMGMQPAGMAEMAPFLAAPSPPPSPMGPHHGGGGPWSPSASIAGGGGGGRPPILPTNINALYRQPRPPPPGGVFFYRSPSGIAAAAAAAATRMGGSGLPLIPSLPMHPAIMPALDTVLRFALLSEVVVKSQDQGLVMSDISHLCTFADHFYVSFNSQIYAYKILFGGNRTYQESAVLVENQIFPKKVTCLHCSRPQPPLLIIGTENGGIFSWDPRKGPRAHMAVIRQPEVHVHTCTYTRAYDNSRTQGKILSKLTNV